MNANSKQAKSIFLSMVGKVQPDSWKGHLDDACGGDGDLRQEIESLLEAHLTDDSFLASPAAAVIATAQPPFHNPSVGEFIGPYKLREQIGEGGMGVVYVAEQVEPVRRKVAVKIVRPGMATKDVIARFEAERQALAMMDHPNIARVFDAGSTECGQPYFVMELVQGLPITEYCDHQRLNASERLELFLKICRAVQHAHQKGIIHRDIKPSNVLVPRIDGEAVPKVIDFGVAKAVSEKLSEQTIYTHFSQMVGTPLYMSPEQADLGVVDIDTRSDIYSLGVLLYELLTGTTPFDRETVKRAGLDEMRRMIREVDPPRPSQRVTTLDAQALSTISDRRRVDNRELGRILRGELDWIVMKALEKNRSRRYETADAMANDIRRHQQHEPVEACPPSSWYRLTKLVRRNRALISATAVVAVALLVGVIAASWQALAATRARDRATAAEGLASRHLERALEAVDQMLSRVGDEKLANVPMLEEVRYELLEEAVQLYDQFLEDAPDEPKLRTGTAITERRKAQLLQLLGRSDDAREPIERSIRLLREELKGSTGNPRLQLELARSLILSGVILGELERLDQAVTLLRRLDVADPLNRDVARELASTLSKVALESGRVGDLARAEEAFAEAEQTFERMLPLYEGDRELRRAYAKNLINFGTLFGQQGNWRREEANCERAIEIGRELTASDPQAEDTLVYATALVNRAAASIKQKAAWTANGDPQADAPIHTRDDRDLEQGVQLFRDLVRDHPSVPLYRERLAGTLMNQAYHLADDHESTFAAGEEAIKILDQLVEEYPTVARYRQMCGGALNNLAGLVLRTHRGDLPGARQLVERAIVHQRHVLQANHKDPTSNHYLMNHYLLLAEILVEQGDESKDLDETCISGLEIIQYLQKTYPDNDTYAWAVRRLTELRNLGQESRP